MLLPLYALLLLSIARDLPAELKTRASLLKNLFYCALCLPYGLKQVCNYILFHLSGQQLAAAEISLPSLVSGVFMKAAGNGLVWLYDGYNLSLALWALLAFSVWRAARRGESLRGMLPFAGYFAVHLLVFVPVSLVAAYMKWYSLLPATCLFLAAYILFHRACGARYAAAAAGLLFWLNILLLPDFLDSADKTAAGATSITKFAQDSFRDRR